MVLRVLVAVALLCSVARAGGEKRWAKGVSAKDQELALTLYNTANDLFEKGSYAAALTNYEAALKAWDHPGIHFNTAICLKSLERWVDAYEHIEQALIYKDEPLGMDLYKEGLALEAELKTKVGTIEVTSTTPGAVVMLDGKPLLDKPGTVKRNVLANEPHLLTAEKPNYETQTISLKDLKPNQVTKIALEMKLKSGGRTERRWARWKPWAVVGGGTAVGLGVGLGLVFHARDLFGKYDTDFAMQCGMGCPADTVDPNTAKLKTSGETYQTLGYSAFAVGGAVVVTGLVLVVMNQPRLVGGTVTPSIGKEQVGATVSFAW